MRQTITIRKRATVKKDVSFSSTAVIRRFLRDLDVVCMAFFHAGIGDLDELGLLLHGLDIFCATITHPCAEASNVLLHYFCQIAFESYPSFDAFGHELFDIVLYVLEIPVAAALGHSTDGAHAAVLLELPAFIDDGFPGALFYSGKDA